MPCSPRHDLCDHGLSSWVTPRGVPGGPTLAVLAGPLSGGPGAGGGAGWSGPRPLSPPASGGSLCPSSLQQPRSPQRGMCWRGGVLRGSLRSLGAVSSTVSFICHLITSVGHGSPPPGGARQTLFSAPTVGTGRVTRSAGPGSHCGKGRAPWPSFNLSLLPHPPLWPAHPASLTNSACQGGEGLWHPPQPAAAKAPTPLAPGGPSSWPRPPRQPTHLLSGVGATGSAPLQQSLS